MKPALGLLLLLACCSPVPGASSQEDRPDIDARISEFVRRIFQDSRGDVWFGPHGDGVVRYDGAYIYDGKNLTNISEQDGLCSTSVNCILEGKDGSYWFATHHQNVCRLDGQTFVNFPSNRFAPMGPVQTEGAR